MVKFMTCSISPVTGNSKLQERFYHKSLGSDACFAKSPTQLPHTQSNHFFASIVAFIKLEAYRASTRLNHFALKGKLYQAALASALQQLEQFKVACPGATTII